MATVSVKFVLIGPHAGKDFKVRDGIVFEKGEMGFVGQPEKVGDMARYLRHWQAYPENDDRVREFFGKKDATPVEPPAPPAQEPAPEATKPNERLRDAILQLAADNDEHWTGTGKPRMDAVEKIYGSSDITRQQVEAAAPGFDRDAARK